MAAALVRLEHDSLAYQRDQADHLGDAATEHPVLRWGTSVVVKAEDIQPLPKVLERRTHVALAVVVCGEVDTKRAEAIDDLGAGQLFAWSSANNSQMIADVQSWLNTPSTNFGWILIGDESSGQTAKRFNSSESSPQPSLVITYTAVPEASTIALLGTAGLIGAIWVRASRHRRMS